MIELLQTLSRLDGPSGAEDPVRDYIRQAVTPYAKEIIEDPMGNLMVYVPGKRKSRKKIMVCAHMDEVGFIVKEITEDGVLKFGFVGGIDPRVVIGRRVRFGSVQGIVGIKAVHLTTKAEREHMPKTSDLYIDIGASSKKEAEAKVSLGDYGTFDSEPVLFGDGLLKAKAIDDRLGCAVMLKLIEETPPVDTWFAFHVQEEVGLRGARPSAYRIQPDVCLVVEGTTAADLANVDAHKQVCALRKGAVIPFMDRGTIYDAELFTMLRQAADQAGVPWQTKQMIAGGTDAGQIHKSRSGVKCCGLAAPVRYIHSPVSVAAISDMENVLQLARLFLKEVGEK
jgi:putative aminopeptidase FrvX